MMTLIVSLWLVFLPIAHAEEPSFGTDVSLGYALGQGWAEPLSAGRYGNVIFRYDAFVRDRNTSGPRMGFGLWGAMGVQPSPEMEQVASDGRKMRQVVSLHHTGILALLRFDPEAPMSGTFGMGFGRLGMENTPLGSLALPALTIEAGGRNTIAEHAFLDWMIRTHWASQSDPISGELEDWWFLELSSSFGVHLR